MRKYSIIIFNNKIFLHTYNHYTYFYSYFSTSIGFLCKYRVINKATTSNTTNVTNIAETANIHQENSI